MHMDPNRIVQVLSKTKPPWIHLVVGQKQTILELLTRKIYFQDKIRKFAIRDVPGDRCFTKQSLLRELARVLEFPPYFGYNWDALEECLLDLADWMPAEGYILLFLDTDKVLTDSEGDFTTLISILKSVAGEWASRRPTVPFHIVLHCFSYEKEKILSRMANTGSEFSIWDCEPV
jgi:RNAse (barnase) inhibitor barstar